MTAFLKQAKNTSSFQTSVLNVFFIKNFAQLIHIFQTSKQQIDINILNELPPDIREEIMKEYQVDKIHLKNTGSSTNRGQAHGKEEPGE